MLKHSPGDGNDLNNDDDIEQQIPISLLYDDNFISQIIDIEKLHKVCDVCEGIQTRNFIDNEATDVCHDTSIKRTKLREIMNSSDDESDYEPSTEENFEESDISDYDTSGSADSENEQTLPTATQGRRSVRLHDLKTKNIIGAINKTAKSQENIKMGKKKHKPSPREMLLERIEQELKKKRTAPDPRVTSKRQRRAIIPNTALPPPPLVPTNLQELIKLAAMCKDKVYRDCQLLYPLLGSLQELDNMIGLEEAKKAIFSYIFIRLQCKSLPTPMINHLIISAPPGSGKTILSKILAKLLAGLGALNSDLVVNARRSDLIGKYLGSTSIKTQSIIDKAIGGVLLIDEVSELTHDSDNSDSFLSECVNTLNRNLTEKSNEFVCIIAGYTSSIINDFLPQNAGLKSRFPLHIVLKPYTSDEKLQILQLKLQKVKSLDISNVVFNSNIFTIYKDCLQEQARSCELLADKITEIHSKACFGQLEKSHLSQKSLDQGIVEYAASMQATASTKSISSEMMYV